MSQSKIVVQPPCPLPFTSPQIKHFPQIKDITQHLEEGELLASDSSFANMYLKQKKYQIELAFEGDTLYRHYGQNARFCGYAFPLSTWKEGEKKDISAAIARIEEDAVLRGRECQFCLLRAQELALLQELRPGQYRAHSLREDSDYIYRQEELQMLPGNGLSKKKGLVAKFRQKLSENCSTWNIEPINLGSFLDVMNIAHAWQHEKKSGKEDLQSLKKALAHWRGLDLRGIILHVDHVARGFVIGSHISPTCADIHYEKCLPDWQDAQPILVQAMASELNDVSYINREADLGEQDARRDKLSYHPYNVLDKYNAIRQF